MNLWKFSWRNLWRNRKRTCITLAALTFTTAVLIVTSSLVSGMIRQTVRQATQLTLGEVQFHAPGYLESRSFYSSLQRPDEILKKLNLLRIKGVCRQFGNGLLSSGSNSRGALFWGIDPEAEMEAFDLHDHVEKGAFFSNSAGRSIVLGSILAAALGAEVGSELIAVAQASDGSLGNELFVVRGILAPVGEPVDSGSAFLRHEDFNDLFASEGIIHEITLNTRGRIQPEYLKNEFQTFPEPVSVMTWRELIPGIAGMLSVLHVIGWIYQVILFLAAGMGVLNSLLMSTFERIREFGLMKALGSTPSRIVMSVWMESLLLSILAATGGISLGIPAAIHFQRSGIDFSRISSGYSFSGVMVNQIWKAHLGPFEVILPVCLVVLLGTLAAVYPALVAAGMETQRAMDHV